MPIFEYKCDDCGTKFEKLVRNTSQAAQLVCPSCGEQHLTQQLSTFAAKVNGATPRTSELPPCASGMCPTPGLCGRN